MTLPNISLCANGNIELCDNGNITMCCGYPSDHADTYVGTNELTSARDSEYILGWREYYTGQGDLLLYEYRWDNSQWPYDYDIYFNPSVCGFWAVVAERKWEYVFDVQAQAWVWVLDRDWNLSIATRFFSYVDSCLFRPTGEGLEAIKAGYEVTGLYFLSESTRGIKTTITESAP